MLRGRIAKHGTRERRQGRPGVGHDGGGHTPADSTFGHDERRPAPQGIRDELGAVAPEAGDRDEGETGLDEARVVSHAPDALYLRRGSVPRTRVSCA